MKRMLAVASLALTAGCTIVPAAVVSEPAYVNPVPQPMIYAPPPPSVIIAPNPYYYRPFRLYSGPYYRPYYGTYYRRY